MMIVEVTTKRSGDVIDTLCETHVDMEYGMKDELSSLRGDEVGSAQVSVKHTISGPDYTSVQVSVGASVRVRNHNGDIKKAQAILFTDCLEQLNEFTGPAYMNLMDHVKVLHGTDG